MDLEFNQPDASHEIITTNNADNSLTMFEDGREMSRNFTSSHIVRDTSPFKVDHIDMAPFETTLTRQQQTS